MKLFNTWKQKACSRHAYVLWWEPRAISPCSLISLTCRGGDAVSELGISFVFRPASRNDAKENRRMGRQGSLSSLCIMRAVTLRAWPWPWSHQRELVRTRSRQLGVPWQQQPWGTDTVGWGIRLQRRTGRKSGSESCRKVRLMGLALSVKHDKTLNPTRGCRGRVKRIKIPLGLKEGHSQFLPQQVRRTQWLSENCQQKPGTKYQHVLILKEQKLCIG